MACGRKHYILVTEDNQMLIWGHVISETSSTSSEGYQVYSGDALFDGSSIEALEVQYSVFGAIVKD